MNTQNTSELFERIDFGLKKAVKKALLEHKQAGRSIHISLDGKIVEVPPEKINISENTLFED